MKPRVLFLCTGNSCRSQMAEGWARCLLADQVEARSAGLCAQGVNPRAALVMAEAGADISRQLSQSVDELDLSRFDLIVTVCDHAYQHCPVVSGQVKVLHQPFDDPPHLAVSASSEEEALQHFRRVRDEIRDWVKSLPQHLECEQQVASGC